MTKREGKAGIIEVKGLLRRDEDFLEAAVEGLVHAALDAEMTEAVGAAKSERTERRLGYCGGYCERSLVTGGGTLEPQVPRDRAGPLLDGAVRALPTPGEDAGGGAGREGCARGLGPEGQGGHRGAVRPRVPGLLDRRDQQETGREPEGLFRAPA